MYSIYVITNTVNGKQYVGYTGRKVDARWKSHVKESKQEYSSMYGSPLQTDIREYGEDCFTHQVLVTTEDKVLAMQLEDEATIILNTHVPNGYNRQVGYHGEGMSGENNPMWGKHHSEDTKKKLSENHWDMSGENHPMWGKHLSEETKKKLSEKLKGRTLSEETKDKISESNSGANNPRARKCICVETGQIFDTIREASECVGLKNPTNIVKCCRGERKTAGGYHWMYYEKYLEQNKEK